MIRFHGVDMGFGRHPCSLRGQHDGGAVSIIGAHVQTLMASGSLEADPDICLYLLQHMTQMKRRIGIGQCRCDQYLSRVACH